MPVLIGPGGVFNPRHAILFGATTPTPPPAPAPALTAFGTMLANFAGAAGSAPVGVAAATAPVPTLDGAGNLPLPANSLQVWLTGLARDGLYTVTLAAPSLLAFLVRSSAIVAAPSCYYTDGAFIGKLANGSYAGGVASGGIISPSRVWTFSLNGPVLTLGNADAFLLTGTDSTYAADGYLAFRTQAQPALVQSVLYQTFAQVDAAYLAAHPPGMTITGVG